MSKILQLADMHLGVPERTQDILWAMRVASEYAYRHDIDTILALGDTFHDREAITIDVLCAAYDFFSFCKKKRGQTWITFPGNHDMFLKHSWSINSLKVFQDVLTIIDTVKILQLNDVRFWVLPFIYIEKSYLSVLKKIEEKASSDDVLLTHVGTLGATKNICFLLKDWSAVTFEQSIFNQVYTGHFHIPQQVGRNVWYPGSLIPFKFDEGDCDHGFLVYDLGKRNHEFISIWDVGPQYFPNEIPPPNYLTVPEECIDDVCKIATNNNVRVAVSADRSLTEKQEIERTLLAAGARNVRWLAISEEKETYKTDLTSNNTDIFLTWLEVDKHNLTGLNMQLLHRLHDEIANEADALYDYGDGD